MPSYGRIKVKIFFCIYFVRTWLAASLVLGTRTINSVRGWRHFFFIYYEPLFCFMHVDYYSGIGVRPSRGQV